MHVEHIVPVSKGGASYIWNLCPSVDFANIDKKTQEMELWYKSKPYYNEGRLGKIKKWIELKGS